MLPCTRDGRFLCVLDGMLMTEKATLDGCFGSRKEGRKDVGGWAMYAVFVEEKRAGY